MRSGPEILDDGLSWLASGVWIPLRERAYWPIIRRSALLCVAVVSLVFVLEIGSPWNVAHSGWTLVLKALFLAGFASVWLLTQAAPWAWMRVVSTVVALAFVPLILLGFLLTLTDCNCAEDVEVVGRVDGTSAELREVYDVGWDGRLLNRYLMLTRYWGPFVREEVVAWGVVGEVQLTGNVLRYCEFVYVGSTDSSEQGQAVAMSTTFDPVSLDFASRRSESTC